MISQKSAQVQDDDSSKFEREAKFAPWSSVRSELIDRVEAARENDSVICINSEPQGCLSLPHPNPLRCTTSLPITHGQLFLSQHSGTKGTNVYSLYSFNRTDDDAILERFECRTDCTLLLGVPKHRVFIGFSSQKKLVVLSDLTRKLTLISEIPATRTILCLAYNKETDEVIAGGIGCLYRFSIQINHYKEELVKKSDFQVGVSANDWITQLELYWRRRQLIVLSNAGIYFISYRTNELVHHLVNHHEHSMTKFCLHPPLDYILVGYKDGCIKVFTTVLYKGVHEFRGHTQPITGLQIHATEPVLISAAKDHTIRLWSLETLELFCRLDVDYTIENLGLIKSSHLFFTTRQTIEIMSMNQFYSLFAMVESEVSLLKRATCSGTSNRIMASAIDGEIRILSPVDGSLLTMVYPMSSSKVWLQYVHNRFRDEIMAVLDCGKVLVLDSSTNPCTPKTVLESSEGSDDVVLSIAMLELSRCMDLNEKQEDDCLVFVGQKNGQIMLTAASHYHMDWPVQAHVGAVISLTCSTRKKYFEREPSPSPILEEDEEIEEQEDGKNTKEVKEKPEEETKDSTKHKESVKESNTNNNHNVVALSRSKQRRATVCLGKLSYHGELMNQMTKDPLEDYDHLISTGTDEFIKIWKIFIHPRHEYELVLICMTKISCHVMPKLVGMVGRTVFITSASDFQLRAFRVWDEHHQDQLTHDADEDHTQEITGMDLNCDLEICVTTAKDKLMKIWNIDSILIREITFSHLPTAVCFANDRGDILVGLLNHIFYFTIQNYLPVDFVINTDLHHRHFEDDLREKCIAFDTDCMPTLEASSLHRSQVSHHKRMEHAKDIVNEEVILDLLNLLGMQKRVDSVTGNVIAPWDLTVLNRLNTPISSSPSRPNTRETIGAITPVEIVKESAESVKQESVQSCQMTDEGLWVCDDKEVEETTENTDQDQETEDEKPGTPETPPPPIALDGYIPNSIIRGMIGYRPPTPGKIIRKTKEKPERLYGMPSHLFTMSGRDLLNPDKKPEDNLVWEDAGERKSKVVVKEEKKPAEANLPQKRGRSNSSFNEYSLKSNFTVDFSSAEIGYEKRANTRRQSTGGQANFSSPRPLRNYPRNTKLKEQIEEEQDQLNPDQVQGHIDAFRKKAIRDPDKLISEILRQKWYTGDKTKRDPIVVLDSLLDTLANSSARTRMRILNYIGMMQETFLFSPAILHNIISHLKDELQHQEADVRIAAIELLIKMGLAPESIYISLIKNLVHENPLVREAAEHALAVLTEIKNKDNLLDYFNTMGLLTDVATQPIVDSRSIQNMTPEEDREEVKEKESRMNNWKSKPNVVPDDLRRERDSLNLGATPTVAKTTGSRTSHKRGAIHIPGRSGSGIVSIADEMSWLEKKTPQSLFEIDKTRIRNRTLLRSSRSFRTTPPNYDNMSPESRKKMGFKWKHDSKNEEVELKRRRRALLVLAETYAKRPKEEEIADDEMDFTSTDTPNSLITQKKKLRDLRVGHFDVCSEDSGFPNTDTDGSAAAEPVKVPKMRKPSPATHSVTTEPETIIEYYQPPPIIARAPEEIIPVDVQTISKVTKAMAIARDAVAKFDHDEAKKKSKSRRHRSVVPEQYEIRELQQAHEQKQIQGLPSHLQEEWDPMERFTAQFQKPSEDSLRLSIHDDLAKDSGRLDDFLLGQRNSSQSLVHRRRATITETEDYLREIKYGRRKNLHDSATEYFLSNPAETVKLKPIVYGKGKTKEKKCHIGTRLLDTIECSTKSTRTDQTTLKDKSPPKRYWEIPLPAKHGIELVEQQQGNLQCGVFNMSWSSGKPETPISLNLRKTEPPVCPPTGLPPIPSPEKKKFRVLPDIKKTGSLEKTDELVYEWDVKSLYQTNERPKKKRQSQKLLVERLEMLKRGYAEERRRLKELREQHPKLEIIAPYTNVNLTPSNSRTRFTHDVLREYMTSCTPNSIIDTTS